MLSKKKVTNVSFLALKAQKPLFYTHLKEFKHFIS